MDTKKEKVTKKKVEGNQLEHHGENHHHVSNDHCESASHEHHHHEKMNENHMEHHHVEEKHKEHLHGTDNHNHKHHHKHHHHDEHGAHMHGHGGHGGHDHSHMIQDFKNRFLVSLILTIPIVLLSPMIQEWFNFTLRFTYDQYVAFILSTILLIYGGKPFFVGAWHELKAKSPAMMSLIAVAITIGYTYSSAVVFGLTGHDFFWEIATLITIMLLGHWLEMKSSVAATNELTALTKLMPSEANLMIGSTIKTVSVSELKMGDVVLVKPGDKVPVDGVIIEGTSTLDESMITGESVPVKKDVEDQVIGGTINGDGVLKVKITKLGSETYLQQVITLVENAQKNRSKMQRLADTFAKYLFYLSMTFAIGTSIYWGLNGYSTEFILERVVTVIIIACPHALGVAVPLVTSISTTIAAKNGLLIKNRSRFETARKINAVVFDKTGTLTEGKFFVDHMHAYILDEKEVLDIAYNLEKNSNHPIAKGIVSFAKNKKAQELSVVGFSNVPGVGVKGTINNILYEAVSPAYLKKEKIKFDEQHGHHMSQNGQTVIYILKEKTVVGTFALEDKIKDEAYEAINQLKKANIRSILLTGDNRIVAENVAKKLGIDEVIAEVLPHQKAEKISQLKSDGYIVAMAGDGINDAPALVESDLGIAIGAGTDVAIESADIVLVRSNPKDVVNLLKLSKATSDKMIQNLIWATGYNIIALPLAAGVLYQATGFLLPPAIGAILMSLSSIIVAINAKTLKIKQVS